LHPSTNARSHEPGYRFQNPRTTVNALNAAAGSSFTVGVIGPLVALFINFGDVATKVSMAVLIVNAAI